MLRLRGRESSERSSQRPKPSKLPTKLLPTKLQLTKLLLTKLQLTKLLLTKQPLTKQPLTKQPLIKLLQIRLKQTGWLLSRRRRLVRPKKPKLPPRRLRKPSVSA